MKNTLTVAFSLNGVIYFSYDGKNIAEKTPITSFKADIGGTSYNVATALQKLGGKAKLIALTGGEDNFLTNALSYLLQKDGKVPYKLYEALTESNFSFTPSDGVNKTISLNRKGEIDPSKVKSVLFEIAQEDSLWRAVTGVRVEEAPFANALLDEKSSGFRSFNPSLALIKNKPIFLQLLKKTDLLIVNKVEYDACGVVSPSVLHDLGPSLVIVTNEEKGGFFSHKCFSPEVFKADVSYIKEGMPTFTVGAGDWFSASFHKMCIENGKPYEEIHHDDLIEFLNFATKVAGKKITMPGASNGPSLNEL